MFLVTFGLFRLDQQSAVEMDDTGRHAVLVSRRGAQESNDATTEMRAFKQNFVLRDPRLLDPVREFPGDATVVMQTLWPNLIVQQQSNTLAMRQIVPLDARSFDLAWTFFGYADDTQEMRQRRLRQANLMGPAGLVSLDDSEAMLLSQAGIEQDDDETCLVEMGSRAVVNEPHMVTETAIRGFYQHLPLRHGAMIAAAPGVAAGLDLRSRLADLYCAYDDALNDGALERWPEFFTEACVYKVIPRENIERGFPVALIYCESRDMLADRVVALRETALFAPRIARRLTSGICLRAIDADVLRSSAQASQYSRRCRTSRAELFLCGRCQESLWSRTTERCALPSDCASTTQPSSRRRWFTPSDLSPSRTLACGGRRQPRRAPSPWRGKARYSTASWTWVSRQDPLNVHLLAVQEFPESAGRSWSSSGRFRRPP